MSKSLRTWLWQLSYALLGVAFLASVFIGVMAWGTGTFWTCLAVAAGSIALLFVLNRLLNPPPGPLNPDR